jgi:aldose 1-epimerase
MPARFFILSTAFGQEIPAMSWLSVILIGVLAIGADTPRRDAKTITVDKTVVRYSAQSGANVFSIQHAGVELVTQPISTEGPIGMSAGVPIMYPSPNRVRDSKFVFEGRTYSFHPNAGPHFIHGLVHSAPWEVVGVSQAGDATTVHLRLEFKSGAPWFESFPHRHVLKLDIRVASGSVRWEYTVDNSTGDKPVPFGFGLHPWFRLLNDRTKTTLTVPADRLMESKDLLPTGKLLPLDGSPMDLRKPRSLGGFFVDDVYAQVDCGKPTVIDFQEKKTRLLLTNTADFRHVVVYTPKDQPHFCVENQTCSTDAHNLFSQGLKQESSLIVVPPGKTHTGRVELKIETY